MIQDELDDLKAKDRAKAGLPESGSFDQQRAAEAEAEQEMVRELVVLIDFRGKIMFFGEEIMAYGCRWFRGHLVHRKLRGQPALHASNKSLHCLSCL